MTSSLRTAMKQGRRAETNSHKENLSNPVKRALLLVLEHGPAECHATYWVSGDGVRIKFQTMEAIHDRGLIVCVTESRHRCRHSAKLTEIGERVARDLQREVRESGNRSPMFSEAVHLLAGSL